MRDLRVVETYKTRGFKSVWTIGTLNSFCRYFEVLVSTVVIFQISGSALVVAINASLRVAPLLLFGWIIGRISDSIERRYLMLLSSIIFSVSSLVAFILMFSGVITAWHLLIISFASGIGWSLEFPSRRSFIGDLLSDKNRSLGIGLDMMSSNIGRLAGPVIAGLTIDYLVEFSFLFSMSLYLVSVIISLSLFNLEGRFASNVQLPKEQAKPNPFRLLISNNMYRTVLVVTVVFNVWGVPTFSMVPVIAENLLSINATLLGILVGAEGAGSLLGSIAIAGVRNRKLQSFLFIFGASLFLVCIFLFSLSEIYLLSLLLLFFGGLGISGFSTMQSVIIVDRTRSDLRGSALGYLSTTIGTQPIGALNVGFTCSIFLPQIGVRISAIEGIVFMILLISASNYWEYKKKFNLKI